MQKWIILVVVCIIIILGILVVKNVGIETEYVPEAEISETELRKTMITLYFKNKESGEIEKETMLIDSKRLLKDPCKELINILIEGPQDPKHENIFPSAVNLLECKIENGIVKINFEENLRECITNEKEKSDLYEALRLTLKQLKEVEDIKILIAGNEW